MPDRLEKTPCLRDKGTLPLDKGTLPFSMLASLHRHLFRSALGFVVQVSSCELFCPSDELVRAAWQPRHGVAAQDEQGFFAVGFGQSARPVGDVIEAVAPAGRGLEQPVLDQATWRKQFGPDVA